MNDFAGGSRPRDLCGVGRNAHQSVSTRLRRCFRKLKTHTSICHDVVKTNIFAAFARGAKVVCLVWSTAIASQVYYLYEWKKSLAVIFELSHFKHL
jgi:hypothetical protein